MVRCGLEQSFGSVSVSDNASDSPQTVSLEGLKECHSARGGSTYRTSKRKCTHSPLAGWVTRAAEFVLSDLVFSFKLTNLNLP